MASGYQKIDEVIDGKSDAMYFPLDDDVISNKPTRASITKTIGSGEDAKNSVIWHIIFTTFCIFSCIVASLIIIDLYRTKGADAVQIVKDIWSIFTPILTLSLGYMFGSDSVKDKIKSQKIFKIEKQENNQSDVKDSE